MLAVIGGSGVYELTGLGEPTVELIQTDFAEELVKVEIYNQEENRIAFLPRHGKQHAVPPHKVNYRANIAALHSLGVTEILGINAVGGINAHAGPGSIIVPTQIVDYTWGRVSTFFEENLEEVVHIDFTNPFSDELGRRVLAALYKELEDREDSRTVLKHGTYGCTQGPRLESAAEILRMKQDGCDIVGMTAMPEVALAREKGMHYSMIALSVNWAAGIVPGVITMDEIRLVLAEGTDFIQQVVVRLLENSAH